MSHPATDYVLTVTQAFLGVFDVGPFDIIHGATPMIEEVINIVANAAIVPRLAPLIAWTNRRPFLGGLSAPRC